MEEEVCIYQKFGYCRYNERCKKKHLEETCQQRTACVNQKTCHKRHPRGCKRYGVEGFCGFGAGCAYHHQERPSSHEKVDSTEIEMKLENLEKTVVEMADQINKLECKIKQMEAVKIPEYDKTLNKNDDSKNPEDDKTLNKNDDSKNPQVKRPISRKKMFPYSSLELKPEKLCQIKSTSRKKKDQSVSNVNFVTTDVKGLPR